MSSAGIGTGQSFLYLGFWLIPYLIITRMVMVTAEMIMAGGCEVPIILKNSMYVCNVKNPGQYSVIHLF